MKIASNKVIDMMAFFKQTLSSLYEASELDEIIFLVFNKYAHFSKTDLLTRQHDNLNQSELLLIYDACKAMQDNTPVQYVLNEAWFYDKPFDVNPSVLIPRPETEELVELILNTCSVNSLHVLDIGTGSGCIPITLKLQRHNWQVSALDISESALDTAKHNAVKLKANVNFIQCDILDKEAFQKLDKFDIIASNPPYIKQTEAKEMNARVKDKEPNIALFVEDMDATIFYKKIIDVSETHLSANGYLFFELNPLTALEVKEYALQKNYFKSIELLNDMSGHCRFFKAQKQL
jgi:release factor glutamine methyltransferase